MSDHKKYIWWEYWDRPILLHQKLTAWALVIGERPFIVEQSSAAGRIAASCRMSISTVQSSIPTIGRCSGVSPISCGVARAATPSESSEKAELRAELAAALGERFAAAYLGEDKTGDEAIRASDGNFGQNDRSRAA